MIVFCLSLLRECGLLCLGSVLELLWIDRWFVVICGLFDRIVVCLRVFESLCMLLG